MSIKKLVKIKNAVYYRGMAFCYNCKTNFPKEFRADRSSVCSVCGRDVKVCKNCRFYSVGSQWDCRETINEGVKEKERSNFCDYFSFREGEGSGRTEGEKPDEARSKFNALFNDE